MTRQERVFDIGRGRPGKRPIRITLNWQSMLALLGLFAIGYSAKSWYDIQIVLYPEHSVFALLLSLGIAVGAPALVSMLIPLTAGGMLWQKVTRQTFGFVAVVLMTGYYLFYCYNLLYAWNGGQKIVFANGLVLQQTIMQMIIYIGIPAICFTPISHERLVAVVEQAQYVKRYELATIGEMIMLEATVKRGHELALLGLANLVTDEKEELSGIMAALVNGQQQSLHATGALVEKASGVALPGFPFSDELGSIMNLAKLAITNRLPAAEAGDKASTALQRIEQAARQRPQQRVSRRLSVQEADYQDYEERRPARYEDEPQPRRRTTRLD